MLGFAYFVLLTMSWFTTGVGLRILMPGAPLPVPFLLSFAVAVVMGYAAPHLVPRWHGLREWVFHAVLYLMLATVSVLFASAFYFQQFTGRELERERVETVQAALLGQLAHQREYFSELSRRLDRLADYSRTQARREDARGGTCAGSAGKGRGPFWAKRMWQAERFGQIAESFAELSSSIEQGVQAVTKLVSDPALDDVARQRALKRQVPLLAAHAERGDVSAMLAELKAQGEYETHGFPNDARYCYQGQCFGGKVCGDERLVQRIQDVLALGEPPALALDFKVYNRSDVMQNVELVFGLWKRVLGQGVQGLAGREVLPLATGTIIDFLVLTTGLLIGRRQRARPGGRLSRRRFEALAERIDDILRHYTDIFPVDRLPPAPPATDEERLHRIQLVLDEVSRPAGTEKLIFLPAGHGNNLRSRRRPVVDVHSERRLEAVIEVLNAFKAARMLGEPADALRNRYTRYRGYDTSAVAHWYGLAPESVAWFSVFIIDPVLMTEATELAAACTPLRLPLHLRLWRAFLRFVHPDWFEHEDRFRHGDSASLGADFLGRCLMRRLRNVRPQQGDSEEDTGTIADVLLYPRLSVQDRVLERLLLDDDYGLHQDLCELPQSSGWLQRVFMPHRCYRLGPRSFRALQAMVDTDGDGETGDLPSAIK